MQLILNLAVDFGINYLLYEYIFLDAVRWYGLDISEGSTLRPKLKKVAVVYVAWVLIANILRFA